MSLNANDAPGGGLNIKTMEAGTYPARLVQVIDMGMQPQPPFQGKDKPPAHEINLTYEFVDTFLIDEDGEEIKDKPRWLSKRMPLHNLESERATSTKHYNALDPHHVQEGSFPALLGTPCNVTVVLNPNKKNPERPWENIGGVTAMRAKDAERCPELVNGTKVFDLDEPDVEVFLALPKFIRERITSNLEYEGSALQKILKNEEPVKDFQGELADGENPF